eukprot:TRINITY_DN1268_c1_g1_i4.p4 TRINITY_DN1268_c1_g1~~TRINITY_DN1268_c1_g1_i4.p4  ORF type:complete len:233 (-),score=-9.03 TRINITY_DN1268_c1_g1_i4:1400-2098(-)
MYPQNNGIYVCVFLDTPSSNYQQLSNTIFLIGFQFLGVYNITVATIYKTKLEILVYQQFQTYTDACKQYYLDNQNLHFSKFFINRIIIMCVPLKQYVCLFLVTPMELHGIIYDNYCVRLILGPFLLQYFKVCLQCRFSNYILYILHLCNIQTLDPFLKMFILLSQNVFQKQLKKSALGITQHGHFSLHLGRFFHTFFSFLNFKISDLQQIKQRCYNFQVLITNRSSCPVYKF